MSPSEPADADKRAIASGAKEIAKGGRIDKVGELCEEWGGKKKDWKKMKGWDRSGNEWHWYENKGRKYGWKLAGERDSF